MPSTRADTSHPPRCVHRHEAALGALLEDEGGGGGGGGGGAAQLEDQVETFAALLLGLARGARGLVLCVEDAEHLDSSSLAVLDRVVQALAVGASAGEQDPARAAARQGGAKLFLLLAARATEGVQELPWASSWVAELPFATHLQVGRLSDNAARELAALTAGAGELPEDVLACVCLASCPALPCPALPCLALR